MSRPPSLALRMTKFLAPRIYIVIIVSLLIVSGHKKNDRTNAQRENFLSTTRSHVCSTSVFEDFERTVRY